VDIKGAKVGFIGAGNMGEPLLVGLLAAGAPASNIRFTVRRPERESELVARYRITPSSMEEMAASSDILMLLIKPQDLETITSRIAPVLKEGTLVISFLAGKRISKISSLLEGKARVIRVMPNTPTALGVGMSGVSYGEGVESSEIQLVRRFLAACGEYVEIPEEQQDALAALSGSGPAYFFAFVEALIDGGVELGLDREIATTLANQTILGAARMLRESGKPAGTLRENVTSPKGMTYEGLKVLSEGDMHALVARAMKAARDRSLELA
jgi:pyrroline-5-carboxylate reductase